MSCSHDCVSTAAFPGPIENRPGLANIEYRIGSYADFLDRLRARLNASLPLAAWTHRDPDDPGIALLEGAAVVGDILTFYQQLYANEAFLRCATWRESVAELVRLSGYRIAPGLGARATFAVTVKGDRPVIVPRGFPVKVQLATDPKPAQFETAAQITAIPGLSAFRLYRPGVTPPIANGQSRFAADTAALAANGVEIEQGDRLMLVGAPGISLSPRQTAVVAEVAQRFDRTEIVIEGGWTGGTVTGPVTAYKLGRAFRHFGHNAPSTQAIPQNGALTFQDVSFSGLVNVPVGMQVLTLHGYNWWRGLESFPLDQEVDDLAVGAGVLLLMQLSTAADGVGETHFCARRIQRADKGTVRWGAKEGAASVIHLDAWIAATPPLTPPAPGSGGALTVFFGENLFTDVRSIEILEALGASFQLTAAPVPQPGVSSDTLMHFGSRADYDALNGRRLQLVAQDTLEETTAATDAASSATGDRLRPVRLNPPLARLDAADFPWEAPAVLAHGNVVEATQGKSEDEAVLGDGDGRQRFQTFSLPRVPLTYLLDPECSTGYRPELEVRVDGVRWQLADSLFGRRPDERVYIVREDAAGASFVQFGDGKTGARLPSGKGNVTARYRTGIGAGGPPAPDAKPQPGGRVQDLTAIAMPGPAGGSAQPESEDSARAAAPGRMQSLGRLVSLADYEAEALAVPGVLKARATWSAGGAAPALRIVILTAVESAAESDRIAEVVRAIDASRGPARWPVRVVSGRRQPLTIALDAGFDGDLREVDVRTAILEALGASGEEGNGVDADRGLFSWQRRQFGETAHGSQIVSAVQNVPGVAWVELKALNGVATSAGGVAPVRRALACPQERLLSLAAADLALVLVRMAPVEAQA